MNDSLARTAKSNRTMGLALVGLGLFFFISTIVGGAINFMWPIFVLGPGLLLFYLVRLLGKKAAFLTIPATMVSTVGLLLFYQNLTGHWESWAYAWSLIMPTALGVGISIYGDLKKSDKTIERGEKIAKFGLGIFAVGAVFFELLLNLGGFAIPLAILLVIAGVYLTRRKKKVEGINISSLRDKAVDRLDDGSKFVETPVFETDWEKVRR